MILKKDISTRFRFLGMATSIASIFIDSIIGSSSSLYNNNRTTVSTFRGARMYGNIGKKMGLIYLLEM